MKQKWNNVFYHFGCMSTLASFFFHVPSARNVPTACTERGRRLSLILKTPYCIFSDFSINNNTYWECIWLLYPGKSVWDTWDMLRELISLQEKKVSWDQFPDSIVKSSYHIKHNVIVHGSNKILIFFHQAFIHKNQIYPALVCILKGIMFFLNRYDSNPLWYINIGEQ